MLTQKKQMVQLGGKSAHSRIIDRPVPSTTGLSANSIHMPSRQTIQSPHRLPQKLSPNKIKPQRITCQTSVLQNDSSYSQLHQSSSSFNSKPSERGMLVDRSNQVLSPGMSLNYSSGVSPGPSRGSSIHQAASPAKMVGCVGRETELERKLKILEGRVGELHREKHQAVGRLNQENRKIYHENTVLKQKVNQLCKALERTHYIKDLASSQRTEESRQPTALDSAQMQICNLKREIVELQQCLAGKSISEQGLTAKSQQLAAELSKVKSQYDLQTQEITKISNLLRQQTEEVEQCRKVIIELKDQAKYWQEVKAAQQDQLQEIRLLCQQNNGGNEQIVKQYQSRVQQYETKIHSYETNLQGYQSRTAAYESKIEQYRAAYTQNQQLIAQLQQQLSFHDQSIKQEDMEQSAVHVNLEGQCRQLEDNLLLAMQQREAVILELTEKVRQLQGSILDKDRELRELAEGEEEKTRKLEDASGLLEKVTVKFEELSLRYSQLSQRYESERGKGRGEQKCKKCQDLLKTVLRLNTYINPKKS